jgi:hypothetical protein
MVQIDFVHDKQWQKVELVEKGSYYDVICIFSSFSFVALSVTVHRFQKFSNISEKKQNSLWIAFLKMLNAKLIGNPISEILHWKL